MVAPPSLSKIFNPSAIAVNGTTSLQFTVTNPTANTVAESGVAFTDTLPAGLTVASGTETVCGGTLTTTAPTGIALSGATINTSSNCQFSVTVTGANPGNYVNTTGNVTSTNGGTGNTASSGLDVNAILPPSIAKVFNPNSIAQNETTSLTFTITNPSANTVALNGVAFSDTLPSGLTVANASATVCGGTLTTTAPTGIALSGATINTNSNCQFSVTVTGANPGNYVNITGNVTSTNGGTGNTATAGLTVNPGTVQITLDTIPTGLQVSGDGGATFFAAPHVFTWDVGSTHTIATTSSQSGGPGTRYVFTSWSDAGAISHGITVPASATTYTASFKPQYQLTTAASPSGGGTVTPASGELL